MLETIVFYLLAGLAILASALVIGQRNPMYSVMLLIASFGALAGLYIQLDAPFVAVAQIIIYAGAIMVLFLVVVMLLTVPREEAVAGRLGPTTLRVGAVLSLLLGAEVLWALSRVGSAWFRTDTAETVSSVTNIGQTLFTQYAFAFEVTSILILVAMVGAVVVARRES
jgi:NADH-quinone oxidoreductase subunit J